MPLFSPHHAFAREDLNIGRLPFCLGEEDQFAKADSLRIDEGPSFQAIVFYNGAYRSSDRAIELAADFRGGLAVVKQQIVTPVLVRLRAIRTSAG